jgi:hypothetical protein
MLAPVSWGAPGLPSAPEDPAHPGSKVYTHTFTERDLNCQGRSVNVFVPTALPGETSFPVVVYGHGQSLGLSVYRGTLEHLAKKGIVAVFPAFDTGFFDQDWQRMGTDYVNLADCAISQTKEADASRVVYAGHSKGAYIAQIASGLATGLHAKAPPHATVLFEPAGSDAGTLATIDPASALTVVFADQDTIVSRDISEAIYSGAPSTIKQLIFLKSYTDTNPTLNADHFWPLTENGVFGGGPEGPFHYYGEWKWLVAAANNAAYGNRFDDPYLYGSKALDSGLSSPIGDIKRSWETR